MIDGISILVVCRGRVALLEELFISLKTARENCVKPSELVVVDNSDKEDAESIKGLCEKYDARYFFDASSVAVKRNAAASHAKYEILYFCDSDCVVTPDILNRHINSYETEEIGAVAGPVILQGEENKFNSMLMQTAWCTAFSQPLYAPYTEWGVTANFSMRRSAYEKTGGFNARFPNKPGGEDVDIGFRIRDCGYLIKSAPQAVVYHSNKTWLKLKDVSSRLYSYGKSNVLVVTEHPDRLIGDINWLAIFLIALIISVVPTVIFDWKIIFFAPIFAAVYLLITCVNKAARQKKNIITVFKLEMLAAIERWGAIVGCFKYKTVKPMFRQILYSQYQEHGTLPENQWTYFSVMTALSCAFLYIIIIEFGLCL